MIVLCANRETPHVGVFCWFIELVSLTVIVTAVSTSLPDRGNDDVGGWPTASGFSYHVHHSPHPRRGTEP